jgi:hypothetical protein
MIGVTSGTEAGWCETLIVPKLNSLYDLGTARVGVGTMFGFNALMCSESNTLDIMAELLQGEEIRC